MLSGIKEVITDMDGLKAVGVCLCAAALHRVLIFKFYNRGVLMKFYKPEPNVELQRNRNNPSLINQNILLVHAHQYESCSFRNKTSDMSCLNNCMIYFFVVTYTKHRLCV